MSAVHVGIYKRLMEAHYNHDDAAFDQVVTHIADTEAMGGRMHVATELRSLRQRCTDASQKARPVRVGGDAANVVEASMRPERLSDVMLDETTHAALTTLLAEQRAVEALAAFGLVPRRRVLLVGPPGTGKTLTAAALAGEMGLPLVTVRMDALFKSLMGETAAALRTVFRQMASTPGVYFFDELDAVASERHRGDSAADGESNRTVSGLLQLLDQNTVCPMLLAATNHVDMVDGAVFRRFQAVVDFHRPGVGQIAAYLLRRLACAGVTKAAVHQLAPQVAVGAAYSDLAMVCDDVLRAVALAGRREVHEGEVERALDGLRWRLAAKTTETAP